MYIIKHRSRRHHDAPGTFYWVVGGAVACTSVEAAVSLLFTEAT